MIRIHSKGHAGGCYGETSSPSCRQHPPLDSTDSAAANVSKIRQFDLPVIGRQTYVCLSEKFWATSVLDFLLVSGAVRRIMSHWWPRFILDGWFRGLLATEKKRPRKRNSTCNVTGKIRTSVQTSRQRASSGSRMAHASGSQWIEPLGSANKTPSNLRELRSRRSNCSWTLESIGNVPHWRKL